MTLVQEGFLIAIVLFCQIPIYRVSFFYENDLGHIR